jgi:hypothetical protein
MKNKFNEMYENLQNGNVKEYRQWLKGLNKANLLNFCCHCATYDLLDIFTIERHYNS